jgi:hypothetical protein
MAGCIAPDAAPMAFHRRLPDAPTRVVDAPERGRTGVDALVKDESLLGCRRSRSGVVGGTASVSGWVTNRLANLIV